MARVMSLRSMRGFALAAGVALAATLLVTLSPRTAGADTYPGLADIAAAKAAVADAQAGVAELDASSIWNDTARSVSHSALPPSQ